MMERREDVQIIVQRAALTNVILAIFADQGDHKHSNKEETFVSEWHWIEHTLPFVTVRSVFSASQLLH